MYQSLKFYLDGEWTDPAAAVTRDVVNPATEEISGVVSLGNETDVDRAVAAAVRAFETFGKTTPAERISLIERIIAGCEERFEELADAITTEIGSPYQFSRQVQVPLGIDHLKQALSVLKSYEFSTGLGSNLIVREPIGACALITPWNWPLSQIVCKLASALAAGCTMVLKPSEFSPFSSTIFAEILHAAGVPRGVVNFVNGEGAVVGRALASHPDLNLVSFTGSTRAGILVAQSAASSVKRVLQELGGKSANIILPDADLSQAVPWSVQRCFANSGQSCQAPTRLLVQRDQLSNVVEKAKEAAAAVMLGDPMVPQTTMGPVVNQAQFDSIQRLIGLGIDEGAELVCGGLGRPTHLNRGYFVQPTIFSNVSSTMTIAREEIFGPVLSILPYDTEEEAIEIANDSEYGLAGYVHSRDIEHARRLASRIRAGRIYLNTAPFNVVAPFGGYKKSGNGREHGVFGLEEYLEVKALIGFN